jgi:hypothetical protein
LKEIFLNFRVEKNSNPTREDIEALHRQYVEAVEKLYQEYNPIYGDIKLKLMIE